jgi:hypothetical protein
MTNLEVKQKEEKINGNYQYEKITGSHGNLVRLYSRN